MKASESTLLQMLGGQTHFVVPLFQRPYSWEKDDWETLWGDILETYAGSSSERLERHFLGSIVTKALPSNPAGVSPFLLIDGQQRLTTLTLALAALRDVINSSAPQVAAKVHELYLTNRYATGLETLKVLPTQQDRPPYLSIVSKSAATAPASRISEAYRYFRSVLTKPDLDDQSLDLTRLEQVVSGGLELVSITLAEADNEYRIFESLNATGQPLTQADLLRNYFFMRLPIELQADLYEHVWLPMQDRLGEHLADYFRYELATNGEFVREGDVYQAWKIHLESQTGDALVAELDRLEQESRLYKRLIAPSSEEPNALIAEGLARLNRWGAQTLYPVLLNVYRTHHSGTLEESAFVEILRTLESFLVRRLFAGVPTNALNRLFLRLWQQIPAGVHPAEGLRRALSDPGRRWPTDVEFRHGLLTMPLYQNGRHDQRHLILERLEETFPNKERPLLRVLTIEHVMPQSLTAEWETMLGSDARETHRRLVHVLGNLTLTAYNPELSNSSFNDKRKLFARSNIEMNKRIAMEPVWTKAQIEARGENLVQHALEIWPGPIESTNAVAANPLTETTVQTLTADGVGGVPRLSENHSSRDDAVLATVGTPSQRASSGRRRPAPYVVESVCRVADQSGFGAEFREICAAAQRVGFYLRPWTNYVMLAPPSYRSRCAILIKARPSKGGGIGVWIAKSAIEEHFGISEAKLIDAFGSVGPQALRAADTASFIAALENTFGAPR